MLQRALLVAVAVLVPSVAVSQEESFQAIAGSAADDVWVIGTRTALRWNGALWNPMPLPAAPPGRVIAAWAGATDNVWAVGERGKVLSYDGTAWQARQVMISGAAVTGNVVGVAGFAANDVYVVVQSPASDVPPMLVRWDGTEWSSVLTLPLPFRVANGGLAAEGGELVVVGFVPFDPQLQECNLHPLMGAMACIKTTGVIARLTGEEWTLTASANTATGGTAWTGLFHNGRSLLLYGAATRMEQGTSPNGRYRTLRPVDGLAVGTFVPPVRGRPASEGGFVRWAAGTGPDTTLAIAAAALFDAGVVVAALTPNRLAVRRLGRWTQAEVEGPAGAALGQATGVYGAGIADAWFVAGTAIVRVENGRTASIAVAAQCIALGARASVTEGCELYDPAPARPTGRPRPSGLPARRPGM